MRSLSRLRLRDLEVSSAVYYGAIALYQNQSRAAMRPPASLGPQRIPELGREALPAPAIQCNFCNYAICGIGGMGAGEGLPFPEHCDALGPQRSWGTHCSPRVRAAQRNRTSDAKNSALQRRVEDPIAKPAGRMFLKAVGATRGSRGRSRFLGRSPRGVATPTDYFLFLFFLYIHNNKAGAINTTLPLAISKA